ncbi:hypothetical protein AVEN_157318-1 [Araneus ventricosus]|uniref:Uncharacterized protein n=1 Tax=Araneus ventricosus TaxID=182803 RepID=A0A4Y2NW97_ARAVE|nr:hypothetical protein AVEN_157318-1 [Araneus ventricosus]
MPESQLREMRLSLMARPHARVSAGMRLSSRRPHARDRRVGASSSFPRNISCEYGPCARHIHQRSSVLSLVWCGSSEGVCVKAQMSPSPLIMV